ncbi:hypothetical protein NXW00_23255 [Bacteroides thetaiotaomicron]|nr:hypothetical protein [Bacteroides thetaiotaomicron]
MANFNKNIRIGSRMIGMDHPTYFIAEIGANFDGSLDKAKRLIDAARKLVQIVQNSKHSRLKVLYLKAAFQK